ncbi:hydroxymethylbilane synthase [Parasediminibacterium sp. JCM 36343]|uniref:hydroxymethylbilane synthase n=1 Tax=Parasediminibacterium sp. JCM 36343 TaxID=3374279 RepID=UPI0039783F95
MQKVIRIGTRESQLAVWQATLVQSLLKDNGYNAELVYIKSEGDIDLVTPLYEMGVQGVFTRSLDIALLSNKIDIAVHSMKDVPTQLPKGIVQSAVLKRASYKDILVRREALGVRHKEEEELNSPFSLTGDDLRLTPYASRLVIATSSIRRKAQWLHRYPNHAIENLRGNVNTRLRKVEESNWHGAIFAAAGLERINLRPENSIDLDWMLPAPAQGAIMVVCKEGDSYSLEACKHFNDTDTAICTKIERDFLRVLLGGCSTPISALAEIKDNGIYFRGNVVATDGSEKAEVEQTIAFEDAANGGALAAKTLLDNGGQAIIDKINNAK